MAAQLPVQPPGPITANGAPRTCFTVYRSVNSREFRVTRPGGRVLFSSYAAQFWPHRLEWFQLQAAAGLIGEIDLTATRDGVIVCKDGFRATTVSPDEFRALTAAIGVHCHIAEVDESSVFCEVQA